LPAGGQHTTEKFAIAGVYKPGNVGLGSNGLVPANPVSEVVGVRIPSYASLNVTHRFEKSHATGSSLEIGGQSALIYVTLIENVFTQAQKQQMIERLTDAMVSIEGEKLRSSTWVVIEEVKDGDLGVGGKPLSTNEARELRAGK
jgi:4-oxalocrotonate tautomerase